MNGSPNEPIPVRPTPNMAALMLQMGGAVQRVLEAWAVEPDTFQMSAELAAALDTLADVERRARASFGGGL